MALTTEARELVTCAELALRDVEDEGVGSRAEVAGALSRGETGGVEESHTPGPWEEPGALGPRHGDPAAQTQVGKNSQQPSSLRSNPGSAPAQLCNFTDKCLTPCLSGLLSHMERKTLFI